MPPTHIFHESIAMPPFFDRLSRLRNVLAALGVDGFLIPRADEHLGEYVPAQAERLAWITGFTGSAGLAIVLTEKAAIFVDGRYVLQVRQEVDNDLWTYRHITEAPPSDWLKDAAPAAARIGYDPLLISEDGLKRLVDTLPGFTFVPLAENPIDGIWTDQPAPPRSPALPYPTRFAGREAAEKRAEIGALLQAAGEDGAILTDPASINWLLNIRGADVPFTPFALGFALLRADGSAQVFMAPEKTSAALRAHLGTAVEVLPRAALAPALAALAGKRVRVDPAHSPVWFAQNLRAAGAEVIAGADPCAMPKARKNAVEQEGARRAHLRDGAALCRFLHWLAEHAAEGRESELSAAAALLAFRAEAPEFRGESFPAISGAGENGAIIHYRVTEASNRPLSANEVYLIDSGAQYEDGTTDVTRTIWTGPDPAPELLRERVTRVLQGHIAIATLRFPEGIAGPHIDSFARSALWQAGLDYDHGTGHGVGAYLSVHEGPMGLSRAARPVALQAGMILSDEPGYYLPGAYGIRLENLLIVQPSMAQPDSVKPFLEFEIITFAPFDRALITPALLSPAERRWLDGYHAEVKRRIGPLLPEGAARAWLDAACAPL
jgi:Xaa-Pro aminopeptidase